MTFFALIEKFRVIKRLLTLQQMRDAILQMLHLKREGTHRLILVSNMLRQAVKLVVHMFLHLFSHLCSCLFGLLQVASHLIFHRGHLALYEHLKRVSHATDLVIST